MRRSTVCFDAAGFSEEQVQIHDLEAEEQREIRVELARTDDGTESEANLRVR